MQFDPNGKYEMITENSDKLDPSIPLVQNAFLKEAYESHVVPLLFLIAVGAKTRTQSMYIAKSLDSAKEEIARLVCNLMKKLIFLKFAHKTNRSINLKFNFYYQEDPISVFLLVLTLP